MDVQKVGKKKNHKKTSIETWYILQKFTQDESQI